QFGNGVEGATGKDRRGPLVAARGLLRIPGRRVARAVVKEVQLGIVGDPAPGAATSSLPLVALPRLKARIFADRLAEFGGLLGINEELVFRSLRVPPPHPPAGPAFVCGHLAGDSAA